VRQRSLVVYVELCYVVVYVELCYVAVVTVICKTCGWLGMEGLGFFVRVGDVRYCFASANSAWSANLS
jgi:hypothetical protein